MSGHVSEHVAQAKGDCVAVATIGAAGWLGLLTTESNHSWIRVLEFAVYSEIVGRPSIARPLQS
jgi:hypothetical protein